MSEVETMHEEPTGTDPTAEGGGTEQTAAHDATTGAPEPIGAVLGRVRRGEQTPAASALAALARAASHGLPASSAFDADAGSGPSAGTPTGEPGTTDPVWIDRFDAEAVEASAVRAELAGPHAPLLGVPVAVKGNIDVEGLPTTAACPTFATEAAALSATAVRRLEDAGAVVIGTTNLDQFATGLNGTRSPYGAPHAVGHPGYISGGSSSGSAVAVARGDVPLALGTDTAGSGRVPAALNGIVGLKPTKGLVSTSGVLPACRTQDVVSIFAADVDSAAIALGVLAGPDPTDVWSRHAPVNGASEPAGLFGDASVTTDEALAVRGARSERSDPAGLVIGVPAVLPAEHADEATLEAWAQALELVETLDVPGGVQLVPIDLAPFLEAGAMLYGSAIVAERYASVGAFMEKAVAAAGSPDAAVTQAGLDPTVRDIVLAGGAPSAAEAFEALDALRALTKQTHAVLAEIDALFTPTVLQHPTHEEMAADPVAVNARLGTFTTFGNLLDLAVLSVPAAQRADGLPFGVSFHGLPFTEHALLGLGARWERAVRGADLADAAEAADAERLLIAVGGAHMAGLPANPELLACGGEYVRLTRTASEYRLHVLDTPVGPRPGIERMASPDLLGPAATPGATPGGAAAAGGPGVEVELWSIPTAQLGVFATKVPPQLAIGPVTLLDGSSVLGFLGAAASDVAEARVVPSWRAFARGA